MTESENYVQVSPNDPSIQFHVEPENDPPVFSACDPVSLSSIPGIDMTDPEDVVDDRAVVRSGVADLSRLYLLEPESYLLLKGQINRSLEILCTPISTGLDYPKIKTKDSPDGHLDVSNESPLVRLIAQMSFAACRCGKSGFSSMRAMNSGRLVLKFLDNVVLAPIQKADAAQKGAQAISNAGDGIAAMLDGLDSKRLQERHTMPTVSFSGQEVQDANG